MQGCRNNSYPIRTLLVGMRTFLCGTWTSFEASACHWVTRKWKWSRSVVSDSLRPVDCSLSGSSVHGIFQARVLEWIAISFSRGSSGPRNQTRVSRISGRRFTVWATREAKLHVNVCSAVTSFNTVMCIKNEWVTFPRSIKSCDFAFQCRGCGFNPWSGC